MAWCVWVEYYWILDALISNLFSNLLWLMLCNTVQPLSNQKVSITNLGQIVKLWCTKSIVKVVFFISNITFIYLYLLYHLFLFLFLFFLLSFEILFYLSSMPWFSYQITGWVFSKPWAGSSPCFDLQILEDPRASSPTLVFSVYTYT